MSDVHVIDIPLEIDPTLDKAPGAQYEDENSVSGAGSESQPVKRSYQNDERSPYWLPNDKTERYRLDQQHRQFAMMLEDCYGFAPLNDPEFAADIGTGTGVWAFEFAERFPSCKVFGTDINAQIPSSALPNLHFVTHDAENKDWDFVREMKDMPGHQLDYVYLRFVVTCFASTKQVFQNAYDNLKPGGYIEICESEFTPQSSDGSLTDAVSDMFALIREASTATGRDMSKVLKYVPWLEEVGFVDIVDKVVKWPLTPWAKHPVHKRVGQMQMANFPRVWSSLGKLMDIAGVDESKVKEVGTKGFADLHSTACHPWMSCHFIYARKPLENERVEVAGRSN